MAFTPKLTIKVSEGIHYNAETFANHKLSNIYAVDTAEEMIELFKDEKVISFDTETTHIGSTVFHDCPDGIVRRIVGTGKSAGYQDVPFCVSISDGKVGVSIYDTPENGFSKFKALAPLFENTAIAKVAHNTKYDLQMLKNIGMEVKGQIHDTMIMSKLVDENKRSHTLLDLVTPLGGITNFEHMVKHYKMTVMKATQGVNYAEIDRDLMTQYAGADVLNCMRLYNEFLPQLHSEEVYEYYLIEMELLRVCTAMERIGMRVDKDYEAPLKARLVEVIDEAEKAVYEIAGKQFNMNSAKQLYDVLVDLGTPKTSFTMTAKGNPCLDKRALEILADQGTPLIKELLEYRKATKLLSTYAMGIYGVRDKNWRVHASINQGAADTGRFSVTAPALQTLGKKDTTIRQAFIPAEGFELFYLDLDSIEYKLYAHYSQIQGLIEQIRNGFDAHTATASMLFHVPLEEVTGAQRTKAKTINFALLYGSGNATLAKNLGCSVSEASDLKREYFYKLPGSKNFVDTVQVVTRTRGHIKMLLGRKRRLSPNDAYKAVNSLMQGGCATYLKQCMVRIHKYLVSNGFKSRMIMTIHDELVFEIHKSETDIVVPVIRGLMEDHHNFRVPITAGVEQGQPNWGNKTDVTDKYPAKVFTREEWAELDAMDLHTMEGVLDHRTD